MGLWGATDADEAKPKHLTTTEKRSVYATTKGWVKPAGGNGNTSADAEVLVAIGGLSGATKLNIADISSVNWNITSFDKSAGGTLSVTANYNEQVAVTGTPTLTVINSVRANHTLSYASGTGTNQLTFTLVIGAADAATDADDVLSVGANAIALNGGTVVGSDGGAATITHSALAASTNITVVA